MHKMMSGFETHRLIRSIKGLFGTKKKPSPHKRFLNEYYKTIWLTNKIHTGVEIVARIEVFATSKMGLR